MRDAHVKGNTENTNRNRVPKPPGLTMSRRESPANAPETVTLERHGQRLFVHPAVPGLKEAFYTLRHVCGEDAEHGCSFLRQRHSLGEPGVDSRGRDYLVYFRGLEPLISTWLKKEGFSLRKRKAGAPPLLGAPNRQHLEWLDKADVRSIRAIGKTDRAMIRCSTGAAMAGRMIAQIALGWPKKRILVVGTSVEDLQRIKKTLQEAGLRPTLAHAKRQPKRRANRVALATVAYAQKEMLKIESRDVVIVVDPEQLVRKKNGLEVIKKAQNANLFGLLPAGKRLRPYECDMLTAVFGLRNIPFGKVSDSSRIDVAFSAIRGGKLSLGPRAKAHTLKDKGIWRHELRNRRIKTLARALVDGNRAVLEKNYPSVAERVTKLPVRRVGVLVENVEHGLILADILKDWPVVAAEGTYKRKLSSTQKQCLEDGRQALTRQKSHVIVTHEALAEAGAFDVLVRADGGLAKLPELSSRDNKGSFANDASRLLIVDMRDQHHPQLKEWSRVRQEHYREEGWLTKPSGNPEKLLNEFLESRPKAENKQQASRNKKSARTGPAKKSQQPKPKAKKRKKRTKAGNPWIEATFSRDSLTFCGELLLRDRGKAAGIDEVYPDDMTPNELGELAAGLSACIAKGTYKPHPTRPCQIPKPHSLQQRTIQIATFGDRMVGKALHGDISQLVGRKFSGRSYGWHPNRSTWDLLADLEAEMVERNRWTLAIDDIAGAYDNVVVQDVLNAHRKLLKQPLRRADVLGKAAELESLDDLMRMIAVVLRGHNPNRQIGIDQGCPHSPTAMNCLLNLIHDVPMTNVRSRCWFRYGDDIAYLTHDVRQGSQLLRHARRLLNPFNLELKGTKGIANLNEGDTADFIGFRLRKQGDRLQISTGTNALTRLREQLVNAHSKSNPNRAAKTVLQGWINSFGPAFGKADANVTSILRTAASAGFREIPRDDLVSWCNRAWGKWSTMRKIN